MKRIRCGMNLGCMRPLRSLKAAGFRRNDPRRKAAFPGADPMPLLCGCLICFSTFAVAQQRTELHWKFEPGKTFYQEITIDGRQTTTVKGVSQPTRVLQTLHV